MCYLIKKDINNSLCVVMKYLHYSDIYKILIYSQAVKSLGDSQQSTSSKMMMRMTFSTSNYISAVFND
jgi:hypothetical protein